MVLLTGLLNATEAGSDIAAFTGSVSNASGITGTLAAVEGGEDVASITIVHALPTYGERLATHYYWRGRVGPFFRRRR